MSERGNSRTRGHGQRSGHNSKDTISRYDESAPVSTNELLDSFITRELLSRQVTTSTSKSLPVVPALQPAASVPSLPGDTDDEVGKLYVKWALQGNMKFDASSQSHSNRPTPPYYDSENSEAHDVKKGIVPILRGTGKTEPLKSTSSSSISHPSLIRSAVSRKYSIAHDVKKNVVPILRGTGKKEPHPSTSTSPILLPSSTSNSLSESTHIQSRSSGAMHAIKKNDGSTPPAATRTHSIDHDVKKSVIASLHATAKSEPHQSTSSVHNALLAPSTPSTSINRAESIDAMDANNESKKDRAAPLSVVAAQLIDASRLTIRGDVDAVAVNLQHQPLQPDDEPMDDERPDEMDEMDSSTEPRVRNSNREKEDTVAPRRSSRLAAAQTGTDVAAGTVVLSSATVYSGPRTQAAKRGAASVAAVPSPSLPASGVQTRAQLRLTAAAAGTSTISDATESIADRVSRRRDKSVVDSRISHSQPRTKKNKMDDGEKSDVGKQSALTKVSMRIGGLMQQVFVQVHRENVGVWNRREARVGPDYYVDYLVGTTGQQGKRERKVGEKWPTPSTKVLMKWSGFPLPTWVDVACATSDAVAEFKERLEFEDMIEQMQRLKLGDRQFERLFPNRYLTHESGYIAKQISLEHNRLSAVAHDWTEMSGGVRIIVLDWTNLPPASENLKKLSFTLTTVRSTAVKKILAEVLQKSLHHIACSTSCKNACAYTEGTRAAHTCCGMPNKIEKDCAGDVKFLTKEDIKTRKDEIKRAPYDFECTDKCKCDPRTCRNRSVQQGRQKEIAVFRLEVKDWALFALHPYARHDFVVEYIGQMIAGGSHIRDHRRYDFTLVHAAMRKDGTSFPFVVNSALMGNESRFVAHSCDANLYSSLVIVERNGECLNRIAFYADAEIQPGEELTLDYFPEEELKDNFEKILIFFGSSGCVCLSAKCRFSAKKIQNYIDKQNNCKKNKK